MIPLFKPKYNKKRIFEELDKIFDSGWTGLGPKTAEFEKAFAKRLDMPYGVFTNSCTSALHLALDALNLPKGSSVVVPDITFVSTAAAVLYAGYIPVLAPVDDNMQLDLDFVEIQVQRLHTPAVVVVHYSGNCCDMDRLMRICNNARDYRGKNPRIVEDCAHSCGSRYQDKPLGTFGDLACFSFHAVKNLPIADGGMVVGKPEYEKKLRAQRWLGIDKSTYDRTGKNYSYSYEINDLGFKSHGNDVMAVIGLANLEILDEVNVRRLEIYQRYRNELNFPIHMPRRDVVSSHHLVSCLMDERDAFIDWMNSHGISIGVHYKPLSSFDYYRRFAAENTATRSSLQFRQLATLPCFPDLTDCQQTMIIDAANRFAS